MPLPTTSFRSAGYLHLQEKYSLACLPHDVSSYVLDRGVRRTEIIDGYRAEYYPRKFWPGEAVFDHLEFALRQEGLHLGLLRALLPTIPPEEFVGYVKSKPTSAYARRLWFLYEVFGGKDLDLPSVTQGNYADLVDTTLYYTGVPERSPRHRINMNLLGTPAFCPMIRRTPELSVCERKRLNERSRKIIDSIPPEIYDRAIQYLYTRETKSSYAIERETPDQKRSARFAIALREAASRDYLQKGALVGLQHAIVDPRFANDGWRDAIHEQNYVGSTVELGEELIHYISPRPEDIDGLMEDFLEASRRIFRSEINPVLAAAAIAWPFVFLHPFSDGNGRLHRFLIHYVLAYLRFVPDGAIFPVSACILRRPRVYEASLEAFSRPLLPLIDYQLDPNGRLTVHNETRDYYRYPDCTRMAEALFGFVEETIETELPAEIRFLRQYDRARELMKRVVDLPNRHADLLIRLCRQNNGTLSKTKRQLEEFSSLSDDEIRDLEASIRNAFEMEPQGEPPSEAIQ
jgi:hypothetical protein